jgi:crotonobetaine/carnitine-CoA ligase
LRIVFGGSDGRANLAFSERFGVRVCTSYGSTEIGFPIVNRRVDSTNAHVTGWARRGYQLRIVGPDERDVQPGQTGELLVRPPARELMLREYLGQPELTARAVVDGWFRTGDAVRMLDDGAVVFVDRLGDTIRRFGENISTLAVENVVSALPDVVECAVVGVPSPVAGQDVLLVVVPPRAGLDPAALFDALRDCLPKHALPAYVAVCDELPKTVNGKTRKADLAALRGVAWASPVVRP